jgi:hypothetical protein
VDDTDVAWQGLISGKVSRCARWRPMTLGSQKTASGNCRRRDPQHERAGNDEFAKALACADAKRWVRRCPGRGQEHEQANLEARASAQEASRSDCGSSAAHGARMQLSFDPLQRSRASSTSARIRARARLCVRLLDYVIARPHQRQLHS